jgi:acetyl esterase/lipase
MLYSFQTKIYGDDMKNMRRISLDGKDGLAAPAAEAGKDGIERIHKVEQAGLELFPCPDSTPRGTVMICPGGGYSILAISHEGRDIAKFLNGCGYDAAVLLYRVSEGKNTRKMALADAMAGLTLLQKRGGEFGLCTKQVGVMGFSAGAHLSARLAHETKTGAMPDFLVLVYPAYLEKDGSLLEDVIPPDVPIFVYVAKNDPYCPSSLAYEKYCREHDIKCSFHLAESGGHGFGLKNPLPEGVGDWTEKLAQFLESL